MTTTKMRRVRARSSGPCGLCPRRILAGHDFVSLDFRDQQWHHTSCLLRSLEETQ